MTDYIRYDMPFDLMWDFFVENDRLGNPIPKFEVTKRKDYIVSCNDYPLGENFKNFTQEHISLLERYGFEKV